MKRQKKSAPPLEAKVEADFMRAVKKLGLPVLLRKMNGIGARSYPDRLVICPKGLVWWVEFKRPQLGKLSPGQDELFIELGRMGHPVAVFTDGNEAALALKFFLMNNGVAL
jgi:hypothetical protein